MASKPATIEDVAKKAEVSIATVSRALHKPDIVSKEARARVEEAVAELGYTVNAMAQRLRTMQSRMIVVLVPDIGNPFYSEILSGIESVATADGFDILIGNTNNDPNRERQFANFVRGNQADGLLLLNGRLPPGQPQGGPPAPVVALCERIPGATLPTVRVDNEGAAEAATRHLIELGHRRIAHITGPASNILTTDRLTGFRRAMERAGLDVNDRSIIEGDFSIGSGGHCVEQILRIERIRDANNRPTAIFCANDEMAMGAIVALKTEGYRVPEDISVIGFDDIEIAAYYDPPLTTIRQPRREIGERGMRTLIDLISGTKPENSEMVLQSNLIVRGSTAAVD